MKDKRWELIYKYSNKLEDEQIHEWIATHNVSMCSSSILQTQSPLCMQIWARTILTSKMPSYNTKKPFEIEK